MRGRKFDRKAGAGAIWLGLLMGVFCAALPARAGATGCALQFAQASPVTLQPGASTVLDLGVVEAIPGACSSATFLLSVLSDSSQGTSINPLSGSLALGAPAQALLVQAPALGGGSVEFRAVCATGCEGVTDPSPTFTLNIGADVYAIDFLDPSTGSDFVAGGSTRPLSVLLSRNGVAGDLTPVQSQVCFDFDPSGNPSGATLTGGIGPCGIGGRLSQAGTDGIASVSLAAAPNMCAETRVRATAIGFPIGDSRLITLAGTDASTLQATGGGDQQVPAQTAFPQPLSARLQCGTASPSAIAGAALRFERIGGDGASFEAGATQQVVATDALGQASVLAFATATPGTTLMRACADPPACNLSAEFALTTLGVLQRTLSAAGPVILEAAPGSSIPLSVQAQNDATAAVGVDIDWSVLSGGGGWTLATSTTDAGGIAQNIAILPAAPGLSELRATRADAAGAQLDFQIESVAYALQFSTPPSGEPGVPLVFGAGVERAGASTTLVTDGVIAWSLVSGPAGAQLLPLDGGQIIDARSRFELQASAAGTYVVRGQYLPPSGLPAVSADVPIEIAGSAAGLEVRFQPPDFALYSDETSPGGLRLEVLAEGGTLPQADTTIELAIVSGNAVFAGAGPLQALTSDVRGRILTPPIEVGSSVDDVRLQARLGGVLLGEQTLAVRPSRYVLQFVPPSQPVTTGSVVPVGVLLTRAGSGASEPLWGAAIQWSAQGGRLQAMQTLSERDGRSFNRLAVDGAGPILLEASFAPGGGLEGARIRVELAADQPSLELISGDGQSAEPGQALPNPVVIAALQGDQPQTGVRVTLQPEPAGSAEVEPASALTGADGLARFRVRLLPDAQSGAALVALREDAPELRLPVRIVVGPGPAQRSLAALSGGDQSARPGSELAAPLVVLAENDGQPAEDVAIRFEVRPQGAASVQARSARTGADGRLEASVRLAASARGPIEIVAVRSDEPAAQARFGLFAELGGSEQRLEIESGSRQIGLVGSRALPLVVRYLLNGEPLSGARVDWEVLSGNATLDGAFSLTDADGLARQGLRFGAISGEVRVRARAGDLDVVFLLESRPAQLEIVAGDAQRGAPGQVLPEPLRVRVRPEPVAGLAVEWRVIAGGGRLDAERSLTDAAGEASTRWTLGRSPGPQSVAVRLPDGSEQIFNAEALGSGSDELRIIEGDGQRLVTGLPSQPLVVEVRGSDGRPAPGVALQWSSGRGVLLGDTETTSGPDGRSSIRVRLDLPGEARVVARVADTELRVEFVVNGGIAGAPGAGGRRRSVAEALDASCDALSRLPALDLRQQDLLQRCAELSEAAGLDSTGIGLALDQLPNDVGLSLARAGDEAMRGQVQNVDQRLRTLRGGRDGATGGRLQFGLGVASSGGLIPLSALPGLALAVDAEALEREIGEGFERWGAFVTGSIGRGRSRSSGQGLRFDYRLGSLTAGVDYRLSDRLVVGAAAGLSRDTTEFASGRGSVDSEGHSLSAYASFWLPRSWYVDANLTAGRNRFELERNLAYALRGRDGELRRIEQRALAKTDARLWGGSVSAGRDWQRRSLAVGGYLRAQFSRVDYAPFEERMQLDRPGSGLALRVESPAWNSLEAVAGLRANWAHSRDWGVLLPNLMLEYSHEFRDDPSRLEMRFLADPTATAFSQAGAGIDTGYLNLGLGVSFLLPRGRSGFIQYERRLLDERVQHWMLSLGARFEF